MPLENVSPNITKPSPSKHDAFDKSTGDSSFVKRPPLAVQNMLKSSTEIGDVGIFAQRPPRVPRSATQLSMNESQSLANSAFLPHQSQRYDYSIRDARSVRSFRPPSSGVQRRDSTRSSRSAYRYSALRRTRPNHYPRPNQHRNSGLPAQPQLHNYRSTTSLRSDPPRPGIPQYNSRPRQPTRAPSPAISNVYEYRYPRSYRSDGGGKEPPSPGSMVSAGQSFQEFRAEHNVSRLSSRGAVSPAFFGARYQSVRRPSFQRAVTPATSAQQEGERINIVSPNSTPNSPTDSIVPFYYDYSESFHGREGLLSATNEYLSHAGERVEACSQDGEGVMAHNSPDSIIGSQCRPAELPTKHNRRLSDQSTRHARKVSSRSNRSTRISSQDPIEEESFPQHESVSRQESGTEKNVFEMQELEYPDKCSVRKSTSSVRSYPSPTSSTFFVNASRSPRNLPDLAARAHSPETDVKAVGSIDAVAKQESQEKVKVISSEDTITRGADFQLPTFTFRPLSIGVSPTSRPITSPAINVCAVPEIISPHPKRPASSQSRKRFSKILDLDYSHSLLDCHGSEQTTPAHTFRHLDRVDEASSPLRATNESSPILFGTGWKLARGAQSLGPPSSKDRWSGVTSHDKSTVESLLEKHIECLGLGSGEIGASHILMHVNNTHELEKIPEAVVSDPSSVVALSAISTIHHTLELHRPTSLTSSAQVQLMPKRLFASIVDDSTLKFPLASSESDPHFSLTWTDEKSLMSGEYADVDSGGTVKRFKLRRHSSPNVTPRPTLEGTGPSSNTRRSNGSTTPCKRSNSETMARNNSYKHRKMRIHLKAKPAAAEISMSSEWTSTDEQSSGNNEFDRFGMTRVPISAVDGFAELSGESASVSLKSLKDAENPSVQRSPDTWSSIVAAMPLPSKKMNGMRRQNSTNTNGSSKSTREIVEPVNTSRVHRKSLKAQDNVPRLAQPDLGPSMRVSQLDLSGTYNIKSPRHKKSSFSEAKDIFQASPIKNQGNGTRNRERFYSFRNMVPSSMRSFTFSPTPSQAQKPYSLAKACQMQPSSSFYEQPHFPETVAMSDFAYRKHKLLEKLKGWCRRRCIPKPSGARKRRSIPPGGFIV